jgi:hypothetical protein
MDELYRSLARPPGKTLPPYVRRSADGPDQNDRDRAYISEMTER